MQYTETLDLGGARSGRPEAPKGQRWETKCLKNCQTAFIMWDEAPKGLWWETEEWMWCLKNRQPEPAIRRTHFWIFLIFFFRPWALKLSNCKMMHD